MGLLNTGITCCACKMRQGGRSDLEDVFCHLSWWRDIAGPGGYTSCMEYLCDPKQIAVVTVLQSQLHRVNGRSAPGDLTIRPVSSTVEALGNEDGPARSKMCGDRTTFHHRSICVEQEAVTQPTSAPVNTMWDILRSKGRFFLCNFLVIKLLLVNCPFRRRAGVLLRR